MYPNKLDKTGIEAFNAMSDAMFGDFRDADTVNVSNVNAWQSAYRQIAGHNASPICYASAMQKAIDHWIDCAPLREEL